MKPADLWKPTNTDFIQNPHDTYREIRKAGEGEVFKAKTGDFVVMGYDDCKHLLQDPSFKTGLRSSWVEKMAIESARRNESFHHLKEAVSEMLVQINPPKHQKIKGGLAKSWPSANELRELSDDIAHQVISELPSKFDAVSHLCRRVPLQVITKFLGIPVKETEKYAMDGINLAQVLGPYLSYRDIKTISQSTERLQTFLRKHILSDSYVPTKLTENIITNYPEKEIINLLLFLFIAGYETTSSLLVQCIYHLVKNKDYSIKIEKYGAKTFINEILSLNSLAQITGRTNTEPIE